MNDKEKAEYWIKCGFRGALEELEHKIEDLEMWQPNKVSSKDIKEIIKRMKG